MLNFTFSNDDLVLRQLRDSARKFAERSLSVETAENLDFNRTHFMAMADLGLSGMSLEDHVGGTDLNSLSIAAGIFEIARMQLGPAIYLGVHLMVSRLIRNFSAAGQNVKLMEDLAAAKKLGAYGLTEPQAGSDAAALITRAERKGNNYILNGEKTYITSGNVADVFVIFARTGVAGGKGISAFVVNADTPGFTRGKPEKKMGCKGAPITTLHFENCEIPESARIGEEGQGYKIALSGLNSGRINIAASACGLSSRAIELAAAHLKERKQFGKPLAEFQGLQFMLADMTVKHRASVLLTRDAAQNLDRSSTERWPASIAKCFATDSAMATTTDAVQLLGGAGYIEEYEVERLMRDAKMLQIVEGTNQVQRMLIARELLG